MKCVEVMLIKKKSVDVQRTVTIEIDGCFYLLKTTEIERTFLVPRFDGVKSYSE